MSENFCNRSIAFEAAKLRGFFPLAVGSKGDCGWLLFHGKDALEVFR